MEQYYKPKQIAPFFSLNTYEFTNLLKEMDLLKTFKRTTMGSFLISMDDMFLIEYYVHIYPLVQEKKERLVLLKMYMDENQDRIEKAPHWTEQFIKNKYKRNRRKK